MFACAMISAPRERNTLSNSIESFVETFYEPLHIFLEPGVDHFLYKNLVTVHHNDTKLGVFWNWVQAARWLIENTEEPYNIIMEDDIVILPGTKEKLLEFLDDFPGDCSAVSLYTALPNGHKEPGFGPSVMIDRERHYGNLFMVIPRDKLIMILDHYAMLNHDNDKHLDSRVGYALTHREHAIYNHNPTLVYHTGNEVSTIVPKGHKDVNHRIRQPFTG